jgi:uncharacterized membrane protein YccC
MSESRISLPRPRWYLPTIIVTALVIAVLVMIVPAVQSDLGDTVLGFVTGLLLALLVGGVLATELSRRVVRRRLEADALDDLEPLRAAFGRDYAARDATSDRDEPGSGKAAR